MIGRWLLFACSTVVLLASPGYCAPANTAKPVKIVVTIHPLAAIVSSLGGDSVHVETLLPPGASPHAYDPVPSDMVHISRCDLFVSVGGGLDSWAQRLRNASEATPRLVVLSQLAQADAESVHRDGDGHQHEHEHEHKHGGHAHSPHLWLDPTFVADKFLPALVDALTSFDSVDAAIVGARGKALAEELRALDGRIRAILAGARATEYIAFHNAWGPFAERYGLNELGVLEEAGGEEPTPRAIAALIRAARAHGVRAILIEPQLPARVAEIIAAEFDGTTVLVDPIGSPLTEGRAGYVELMEYNANAFARALALGTRGSNGSQGSQ